VRFLLDNGVDFQSFITDSRISPLFLAANQSDLEMISLLLESGANIEARDEMYRTPLHYVV
jgi:ankyrin repeat protein